MKTGYFVAILVVVLLVGIGIGWTIKPAPPLVREKVTFGLDWAIYGRHAPFFVAKEKGYYDEAGLDVTIVRGFGSADAVSRVDMGTVDFGFGDLGSLVLARAKGAKVKMVAMIYSKAPFTVYTLPESGISTMKDLEGHSLAAISTGDANYVLFQALSKRAGIDATKVNWVFMDPAAKVPMLLEKKVDAITEFIMTTPRIAATRPDVRILMYADYGLDIYSNGILVKEEKISKNPELVRKFVQATLKRL
jgi:NitT/TauT family transport system substrate-binding protein